MAKTRYINLNARSNHAKMQSEKILTTQIFLFPATQQM